MAMKQNRRSAEIFSMSFLDIICCGFGAMVLLVLLSNTDVLSGMLDVERAHGMLSDIDTAKAGRAAADDDLARLADERARLEAQLRKLADAPAPNLPELQRQVTEKQERVAALQLEVDALAQAKNKPQSIGGIAVDSEYIVFIVDTSGSMKEIKKRVMDKLKNILNMHPQTKGFRVMNSNGNYLRSSIFEWRPDTKDERSDVVDSMNKKWWGKLYSHSSPKEGIKKALKKHGKTDSLAIYVFGDDHAGHNYAGEVEAITKMNRDPNTGEPRARINGIGFLSNSPGASQISPDSFAGLMTELARRNRGAFVGESAE